MRKVSYKFDPLFQNLFHPQFVLFMLITTIQIAELLKCMLSHTGDQGSRLDTLDDIDTEKNCPFPQIASLLLNSYHLTEYFSLLKANVLLTE